MADMEVDPPAPAPAAAAPAKKDDDKKRFEVKKVRTLSAICNYCVLTGGAVECCRSLGVGYAIFVFIPMYSNLPIHRHCCRQLRHLPQPYHGPLYAVASTSIAYLLMSTRHRLSGEPSFRNERRV